MLTIDDYLALGHPIARIEGHPEYGVADFDGTEEVDELLTRWLEANKPDLPAILEDSLDNGGEFNPRTYEYASGGGVKLYYELAHACTDTVEKFKLTGKLVELEDNAGTILHITSIEHVTVPE